MGNVKEVLAKRWEVGAENYAKNIQSSGKEKQNQWIDLVKSIIPVEPKLRVLDVGTGPGVMALMLASLGHNTTGLDLSKSMLDIAKAKAEEEELDCDFVHGDAEDLPFSDETFDLVVNRLNLWTLPNPGKGVFHWARVLKPGGKLIIIANDYDSPVPNDPTPQENKKEVFSQEYYNTFNSLPFRHATAAQIKALLEAAGLINVDITTLDNLVNVKSDVPFCLIIGEKK